MSLGPTLSHNTCADSDVIPSTRVTATMLEVCYVAAVQRRKLTHDCKLLCVELNTVYERTLA